MILQPVIDYELSRDYTSTWAAMERLVAKGKARLISEKHKKSHIKPVHTDQDSILIRGFQFQRPKTKETP